MAQLSIGSYIEGNQTAVTSATAKLVGQEIIVGDLFGAGTQVPDVNKQRSTGVFIGIDGRKN